MANFAYAKHQTHLIGLTLFTIGITLVLCFSYGTLVSQDDIEWTDVVSEGGIMLVTLFWIILSLLSRPLGKITNLMIVGLLCLHISSLVDFLDEFLHYSAEYAWISTYEATPAPVGMVLMTLALVQWYKEQVALNAQLRKREGLFRDHELIDHITGLYTPEYMRQHILHNPEDFTLVMLDIDRFDSFVCHHGDEHADRLLREVGELILMNIRVCDLACRYSGDRFVVLLPNSLRHEAELISKHIQTAVKAITFKTDDATRGHTISISTVSASSEETTDFDTLIQQLNQRMEARKMPQVPMTV